MDGEPEVEVEISDLLDNGVEVKIGHGGGDKGDADLVRESGSCVTLVGDVESYRHAALTSDESEGANSKGAERCSVYCDPNKKI